MTRAKAVSTHGLAREVATETLSQGGTALRSVLSGFFAAAGESPGVLFGPLTLFVGGVGTGARAFDGRCRQPGLEGKRPRGFLSHDPVPEAAKAAIPGSIWALGVATAYQSGASLSACTRAGIAIAKRAGAASRAQLLEVVASQGTRCFLQPALRQTWLSQLGPVEGGAVQPRDLEPRADLDAAMVERDGVLTPPWERESIAGAELGTEHGLVAVDAAGTFVALTFRDLPEGLGLGSFEVTVPQLAQPVLRGVQRVAPGLPLPTGARIRFWKPDSRTLAVGLQAGDQVLRLYRDHQSREITAEVPGISS